MTIAVWLQAGYWTSLCPHFLICEKEDSNPLPYSAVGKVKWVKAYGECALYMGTCRRWLVREKWAEIVSIPTDLPGPRCPADQEAEGSTPSCLWPDEGRTHQVLTQPRARGLRLNWNYLWVSALIVQNWWAFCFWPHKQRVGNLILLIVDCAGFRGAGKECGIGLGVHREFCVLSNIKTWYWLFIYHLLLLVRVGSIIIVYFPE